MDYFREWAGEIATSYLQAGAMPTHTLSKIAQQEDLTPHHIEVLAAEANKEIHRQKFAGVEEKYFAADFPLADAREAIRSLQADGGKEKIAMEMPEPSFKSRGADPFDLFGIKEEPLDKTAHLRHELKGAYEKCAQLDQKLRDHLEMTKAAALAAETTFIKQARQYVVGGVGTSAERLRSLGRLDQFLKSASMECARPLLAKVAYVLGREGLIEPQSVKPVCDYFLAKTADMKAPAELISEWLPAQIVNGNHPLYITLKTFRDQNEALELGQDRHKLVEDRLQILKQKVRAL